jgi:hypothetical protein
MEVSFGDGVVRLTYDFIEWQAAIIAVVLHLFL